MYEDRLGGEFSTLNFQAVKAKACGVGPGAAGAMKVWNAAWARCQQLRQHLDKMQKSKKPSDKERVRQPPAEDGGVEETEEGGEARPSSCQKEGASVRHREGGEGAASAGLRHGGRADLTGGSPRAAAVFPQTERRPREHHGEADLRTAGPAGGGGGPSGRQHLGRSLSEGSHKSRTQPDPHAGGLGDGCGSRHLRSKSDGQDEYGEGRVASSEIPLDLTSAVPTGSCSLNV